METAWSENPAAGVYACCRAIHPTGERGFVKNKRHIDKMVKLNYINVNTIAPAIENK